MTLFLTNHSSFLSDPDMDWNRDRAYCTFAVLKACLGELPQDKFIEFHESHSHEFNALAAKFDLLLETSGDQKYSDADAEYAAELSCQALALCDVMRNLVRVV